MKKPILIGVSSGLTTALLTFLILTAFYAHPIQTYKTHLSQPTPPWSGYIIVEVWRNSKQIYYYETSNIIVTIGAQYIRNLLTNNTVAAGTAGVNQTKYIAMSADPAPTVTWTKLPNEITGSGLARQAGAISYPNSTAYWSNATWTATASATVNCTGIYRFQEADSNNNLVAAATITTANLVSGDQITIKWLINVQQG